MLPFIFIVTPSAYTSAGDELTIIFIVFKKGNLGLLDIVLQLVLV